MDMLKDILDLYHIDLKTAKNIKRVIFHLKKEGIHPDDFVEYIDRLIEIRTEAIRKNESIPEGQPKRMCECGGEMVLREVNDNPGTQTGDDSKYVWMCMACLEQIFVKEI